MSQPQKCTFWKKSVQMKKKTFLPQWQQKLVDLNRLLGRFWKLGMELNYVPFVPRHLCVLNYYMRTCPCALNYYILKHLWTLIFHVPIYIFHAFVPLCFQLFCVYNCLFLTYWCVYDHTERQNWHISSWCKVWWKLIF